MRQFLAWLLAALALIGASAAQADYPTRPDGPVLDTANIIPDADERTLVERLSAYNQATGRALMVVTTPSLEGEDVATYTVGLGHKWGVGGKDTDQGMILLIAPNERQARIEVGYGLEQYLPDVLAARIMRDAIAPRFKAGDFPGGINAGMDEIIAQLNRDPAEAKAIAEAAKAASREKRTDANAGGVVFWIIMILFFMLMFGRRQRGRYRRSGIDPGIVLWGLSEIAHHAGRGGGFDIGGGSSGGSSWGGFGGGDFGGGGASGSW
ncbi:MAG: TPM domain-containing protein [Novosphingobium sp.]